MAISTIKTLELTLGAVSVECQLSRAQLTDSPTTETLTSFCGSESTSFPAYVLNLGGWQDYGQVEAVCDMLHDSYLSGTPINCVLTVGTKTRTFDARPAADVPFGGDAGSALTFETTLTVVGDVTDGDVGG